MSSTAPGFLVEQLCFGYRAQVPVLSGLSFYLPGDKIILLTGENGTGKSTLLNLLADILLPDKGSIRFGGVHLAAWHKPSFYRKVAVFQQKDEQNRAAISPEEELALWLLSESRRFELQDERISQALADWNLTGKRDYPVWELSAGEQKRLTLAGMNLFPQRYWLLDEPTAGLDEAGTELLIAELHQRRKTERGALLVTHHKDLFQPVADEVWTMQAGGNLART